VSTYQRLIVAVALVALMATVLSPVPVRSEVSPIETPYCISVQCFVWLTIQAAPSPLTTPTPKAVRASGAVPKAYKWTVIRMPFVSVVAR
jgi:hypothetical protein